MEHLNKELADKLVEIAAKQFQTGYDFKKGRMEKIRKHEEFYYGRKIIASIGRSAVPLPVMSSFVDTLMSKIDDAPTIKYGYTDIADLKLAQKTSAAWQKESHPTRGNWNQKDRWGKKLAIFSGREVSAIYAESDPKYKSHYDIIDHEDFVCEPMGGGDLEKHLFCGRENLFKTKAELKRKAKKGLYSATQLAQLLKRFNDSDFKKSEDIFKDKKARYAKLGLDLGENTYVGQPIFKFIEWVMEYEGTRYYLLWEWFTRTWLRAHELKNIYKSNLWPFESWATHEDAFVFWSKSPCDDALPLADAADTLFNQIMDNIKKRNMGQRAYDPDIFTDPSELEWRPDGLVIAKAHEKGKNISQGIYEFKTPEITGTVNMLAFVDNFLGRKSGINPEAPGTPEQEEQKVGIYFGQLQQAADRLGLYNKSYRESWARKGLRYAWGLYEHLSEPMLVKIIGERGVEWQELTSGESKKAPDLDIEISGGSAEIVANEAKMKKRENAMVLISKDPELREGVNSNWRLAEILKFGGYEEDEVRVAMSNEGTNLEILAEASQAIQDILKGKEVKINRGADASFVQKIIDFASDTDLEQDIYKNLITYAQKHIEIVMANTIRRARAFKIKRAEAISEKRTLPISEGQSVEEPIAGTPGGTLKTSQEASSILRGKEAPVV